MPHLYNTLVNTSSENEKMENAGDSERESPVMDQRNRSGGAASASNESTFDTSSVSLHPSLLASLHTYLGEVEDTHHRLAFLDGGAILKLPLFYLEGVVLFPEAILPLRIIQPNFISAVERALGQVDAPCTVGVVRVYPQPDNGTLRFAAIGTTAEIRQYRRLEDGSMNVVTRGQQRFRLRRRWIDVEGTPCGEVQIIEEDLPLRIPRDAVGKLAPLRKLCTSSLLQTPPLDFSIGASYPDDDKRSTNTALETGKSASGKQFWKAVGLKNNSVGGFHKVTRSFWPFWVYNMYDSYCLAQRAADMWKRIVGMPSMDGLMNKPDLLSFYIASKIPLSESTRQELLEIDGISYRLRREIELLESFDLVRCRECQTVIARRSDLLVMSSEGPLSAYVNPHGNVHEIMTVLKAEQLVPYGNPVKEYSWFPGYAWTVAGCATCASIMGWLYTATNRRMNPRSFWGIRSSQIADDMH